VLRYPLHPRVFPKGLSQRFSGQMFKGAEEDLFTMKVRVGASWGLPVPPNKAFVCSLMPCYMALACGAPLVKLGLPLKIKTLRGNVQFGSLLFC